MVPIRKGFGILSCGFLLCLGLSNAVQAEHAPSPSDVMKTDKTSDRQGFQADDDKQMNEGMGDSSAEGAKMIQGELFRIKGGDYFVKLKNGQEVRLHTDKTTQVQGDIKKGDRIEAKVNEQNHVLSIRSVKSTDRRNEADHRG